MSPPEFENLSMHATVFGIQKFKSKCLHEFPLLIIAYSPENMQLPIDKTLLRDLLNIQIEQRGEAYLIKSLYNDIIQGRTLFEIKDDFKNLIIQSPNGVLVDLNKTYFTHEDKIFKITATLNVAQQQTKEPFLSMLFKQPIYCSHSTPADTNSVIHALHQYLTIHSTINYEFSIILDWGYKHGWGTSNLISSLYFANDELQNIKFVNNPFLLFDSQNVILDLSFFDRRYPK